jgi:hypothetical protein
MSSPARKGGAFPQSRRRSRKTLGVDLFKSSEPFRKAERRSRTQASFGTWICMARNLALVLGSDLLLTRAGGAVARAVCLPARFYWPFINLAMNQAMVWV